MSFAQKLEDLNACFQAREWVGKRSMARAWAECDRADWMLWLVAETGVDRKLLVRTTVEAVKPIVKKHGGKEANECIRVTLRWCDGKATDDELKEARAAADAAYATTAAAAAAYADAAAAYADAAAADAAAYAATAAAYAATAAASAADAYAAAKDKAHKQMCGRIRKHLVVKNGKLVAS